MPANPPPATTSPAAGLLNFRSVAGYPAGGGRVRANALYRSGAFDGIAEAGLARLREIGVTCAFDLRSNREKTRRPSPLLHQSGFRVVTQAHDNHSGDLAAILANPASTPEECRNTMRAIYRRLPAEFAAVYRLCLDTLLTSDTPVAVHCTAGKDRTGAIMALVLDLLGVHRDDILDDYLHSNAARDQLRDKLVRRDQGTDFGVIAPALVDPLIAADESYLASLFAQIDADHGGTRPYAARHLGLDAAGLERLRARLLE